ncbi:MAG: hypothetical protein PHH75_08135 [Candidatus Omnitrophica bacterium]|nr:hypothetical protein [Candidatus Omnitrophota bacterium]
MNMIGILAVLGVIVILAMFAKFALRLGCLFFMLCLIALIAYLWASGKWGGVGSFFRKKASRKAAVSVLSDPKALTDAMVGGFTDTAESGFRKGTRG